MVTKSRTKATALREEELRALGRLALIAGGATLLIAVLALFQKRMEPMELEG